MGGGEMIKMHNIYPCNDNVYGSRLQHIVCPRCSSQFYIETYYIKWVTTHLNIQYINSMECNYADGTHKKNIIYPPQNERDIPKKKWNHCRGSKCTQE